MTGQTLYAFKRLYADNLLAEAKSGTGIASYLQSTLSLSQDDVFRSVARTNGIFPQLQGKPEFDIEDAIRLHQFLRLTPLEASDPRLWAHLAHVEFRSYMQLRWPVNADSVSLASEDVRTRAARLIASRWFTTGKARSLGRHGLSRLWWATELTAAPWDYMPQDTVPRYSDRYHYTRLLFTNQSLLQELLDRKIGWSRPVLLSMLEALNEESILQGGRQVWRTFFREANFILGYRKLSALDTASCIDVFVDLIRSMPAAVEQTDTLEGPLFDNEADSESVDESQSTSGDSEESAD